MAWWVQDSLQDVHGGAKDEDGIDAMFTLVGNYNTARLCDLGYLLRTLEWDEVGKVFNLLTGVCQFRDRKITGGAV